MIIYDLKCSKNHQFEGWFPNQAAFEAQRAEGLVICSVCGDIFVERILSGGHAVGIKAAHQAEKIPPAHVLPKQGGEILANTDPVVLIKMVQEYVQKNFKDVGTQFPSEIRKMHNGEKEKQNIYGTASREETKCLVEDEIPFVVLPKLPDSFNN